MEKISLISNGREFDSEVLKITLRPFDLTDIDDFMEWAADDKVSRFCTWNTYTCKEDGINYINNIMIPHPWCQAICVENKAVGAISVTPNNSEGKKCRAELGYVLATKYWGRGIATRAVKMVAATIFKEWTHLERLEALVDVDNLGSQKVLEKAGFMKEGVLRKYEILKGNCRDMAIFSLLCTDPPEV